MGIVAVYAWSYGSPYANTHIFHQTRQSYSNIQQRHQNIEDIMGGDENIEQSDHICVHV